MGPPAQPIIVLLPDGSASLYDDEHVTVSSVLNDHPGHDLLTTRARISAALPIDELLEPGSTYYLAACSQESTAKTCSTRTVPGPPCRTGVPGPSWSSTSVAYRQQHPLPLETSQEGRAHRFREHRFLSAAPPHAVSHWVLEGAVLRTAHHDAIEDRHTRPGRESGVARDSEEETAPSLGRHSASIRRHFEAPHAQQQRGEAHGNEPKRRNPILDEIAELESDDCLKQTISVAGLSTSSSTFSSFSTPSLPSARSYASTISSLPPSASPSPSPSLSSSRSSSPSLSRSSTLAWFHKSRGLHRMLSSSSSGKKKSALPSLLNRHSAPEELDRECDNNEQSLVKSAAAVVSATATAAHASRGANHAVGASKSMRKHQTNEEVPSNEEDDDDNGWVDMDVANAFFTDTCIRLPSRSAMRQLGPFETSHRAAHRLSTATFTHFPLISSHSPSCY